MKIKVSEATGPVLNWLVAKAQGATNLRLYTPRSIDPIQPYWVFDWEAEDWREELGNYDPSENWSLGGPIIEDEGISCIKRPFYSQWSGDNYSNPYVPQHMEWGDTPLIAAMRCYVTSKLGDEVDVPEELK